VFRVPSSLFPFNRKDRASLLRRKGYEGQERYHKSFRRRRINIQFFTSGLSGLGHTATELAQRPGMTHPAVSYAVSRGEQICKGKK
jgi:hypothetical protein